MRLLLTQLATASSVAPGVDATPKRVGLTLLLGLAGAVLFSLFHLPLAWMMGAMTTTTIATMAGLPAAIYSWMRALMLAVLGVLLGSAFTPEIVSQAPRWLDSILLLLVYLSLSTMLCYFYFTKIARYDPVTAFFSSCPGGLSEMIALGDYYGGNTRRIALTHATRVLLVVATVPLYFKLVAGADIPSLPTGTGAQGDLNFFEVAILCGCGVVGYWLGHRLRIPAAGLVGPLVLSALTHGMGISSAGLPSWVIASAQLVVGAAIGCRFAGLTAADMTRTILRAAGSTIVLLGLAVGFAFLTSALVHQPVAGLVLALSPGGLTEMALVSLSLGVETAFVSAMHILRITVVVLIAAPLFRALGQPGVGRPKNP